ncbi:hypothetical protein [Terribacillus sp. 7520-G]|uniref:hypothetical protein n=1 Tax=unclassified Terribacillus TaxID=2636508 RepID=UPI000BA670E5|nr:hypothetical protein [Terribacillus sp. 7520-G]PAD37610.1 hypothetical protein CHH53_15510 [Terribacillus sp. 7520-G]
MNPWRVLVAFMLISLGAFSVYINLVTTPQEIWYTYSLGAAVIAALQLLLPKQLALVTWLSAIIIGAVIVRENLVDSPSIPWYLYTIGGLVLWPVAIMFRKHLANLGPALIISLAVCIYYYGLHSYFGHDNPWYGFVIFAMSWWPLSIIGHRSSSLFFSVLGFGALSVFFLFVNIAYSPSVIWAIYPIFAAAWWPLSAYFYSHRRHLSR